MANENVPGEVVEAARGAGIDLACISESAAGADDRSVLAMSLADDRVLVTFDKDFGELAFRQGRDATCGVILLRPRLRSPDFLARFLVLVLTQPIDWKNNFAVANEGNIRVVPLP